MSCTVENRKRVRRAPEAVHELMSIVAVDVVTLGASQYDRWTLDAVLRGYEGVPPEVLRELALARLMLRPTSSQGEFEHVAATV